jgi:hypothetical protein
VSFLLPSDHGLDADEVVVVLEGLLGRTTVGDPRLEALVAAAVGAGAAAGGGGEPDEGSQNLAVFAAPAPLSSFEAPPWRAPPLDHGIAHAEAPAPAPATAEAARGAAAGARPAGPGAGAEPARPRAAASAGAAAPMVLESALEVGDRYEIVLSLPTLPATAAAATSAAVPPSGLSVRAAGPRPPPPLLCAGSHVAAVRVAAPAPGWEARLQLLCPVLAGAAGAPREGRVERRGVNGGSHTNVAARGSGNCVRPGRSGAPRSPCRAPAPRPLPMPPPSLPQARAWCARSGACC